MEITQATSEHLDWIFILNSLIDYGNPECFIQNNVENWCVFVALRDEEVVGFSLYQTLWGNTVFLSLLKVHPDFQKQWIWTQLINRVLQKIQSDGFNSCLSSTERKNILSQKFHNKLWFYQIGELEMPHWAEIFYRKDL